VIWSGRWAAKLATDNSNGLQSSTAAELFSVRETFQFAKKWDISMSESTILTHGIGWGEYGLGAELGYGILKNVWVSSGYNVFGFRDPDLAATDVTRRGAFIRLRFKFDEKIFQPKGEQQ